MNEKRLIAGCVHGESWARKEIYEYYAPLMMSVCMRYVNDREVARDLLQDGFIKIFTKIESYTGEGAFGAWIRRIFVTTALEYLRSKESTKMHISIDNNPIELITTDVNILDQLSADDLLMCVARLPHGYRTVFNLHAIEGYSHKEVAEILEISEVTSRTQFIRARNVLQKNVLLLMKQEDEKANRV